MERSKRIIIDIGDLKLYSNSELFPKLDLKNIWYLGYFLGLKSNQIEIWVIWKKTMVGFWHLCAKLVIGFISPNVKQNGEILKPQNSN